MIRVIAAAVMSVVSFLMMGWDKRCARKGHWRVSEKALFVTAILMGAVGGTIGMKVFRHKTKHWYFYAVIVISVVLWGFALFKLYTA